MNKIYFNKRLTTNWWVPFLVPILWINWYDDWLGFSNVDKNQLTARCENWKNEIMYSNIKDCDFCVFPIWYKIDFFEKLKKESDLAKKYNKKIVVFYSSDNEVPIPNLGNLIVFRTSLRNDSPNYEYLLPTFIPSIWNDKKSSSNKNLNNITIWYTWYSWKITIWLYFLYFLRKIKFVRYIAWLRSYHTKILNLFKKRIKNPTIKKESLAFLLLQSWSWKFYRQKCINSLKKSYYTFKFAERKGVLDPMLQWKMRKEYIDNIYNSTFTLVVRWYWNYAHRLYETMSAWKIPLFVDTHCRLPFKNKINYNDLFLIIPFSDINHLDIYIWKFLQKNWNNLKKIEKDIHDVYENYYKMESFFPKIIKIIKEENI